MTLRRFYRRTRRTLIRTWDATPPFPRPPSLKKIAAALRRFWAHPHSFGVPRIPSREEIAYWWRQRRHFDLLPPLPRIPSARKIAQRFKEKEGYQTSLLPEVPSPRNFAEWLRARPSRKKWVAVWAALLLFGIAGFFAWPTASRGIKGWQARKLANQALVLIDQQNWNGAVRKLQSAFQLRATDPVTWRAYARFLSRTGQATLAIEWWQKFSQGQPLLIDDRRDYASAALAASELTIASEQIAMLLSEPGGPGPRDILFAGQLATLRGYKGTAIDRAEAVLKDPRADPRDRLGANQLILANSSPEFTAYQDAFQRLLETARDEENPASPHALAILAQQNESGRLTRPASSLEISTPNVTSTVMSLHEIADRLDHNPNSRPFHLMLALELRARAAPSREDEFVSKGIELYRDGDDETLIALSTWLYSRHRYEAILDVLPLDRAIQRRELLTQRIDALAELNRFPEVIDLLMTEHPVLEPAFAHMYLAVVRAKLGEDVSASAEWHRALDTADSPRSLLGLAEYAQHRGAPEIADAAYARLIKKQPGLKSPYVSRFLLAQNLGETAKAYDLGQEIMRLWPEDDVVHMRQVYLRLLLDSENKQNQSAEEEAGPFLKRNPWDGGARSAVALAQLKQGKFAAALTTLTEFTPNIPSSAVSQPVYAAALNASGWKDKAREQANQLATSNILPEERAMIQPLLQN